MVKTIDRIIDAFPRDPQKQVPTMLDESLKGVICRQRLRRTDRKGPRRDFRRPVSRGCRFFRERLIL